jgi:FkbM family methyltransferase
VGRGGVYNAISRTPAAQFYFLSNVSPPSRGRVMGGNAGYLELRDFSLTNLFYVLLHEACQLESDDGSDSNSDGNSDGDATSKTVSDTVASFTASRRSLVADIGANIGYFGLFSAALGCRVLSLEIQDSLSVLATQSYAINGWLPRVCNVHAGVGPQSGKTMRMTGAGENTHLIFNDDEIDPKHGVKADSIPVFAMDDLVPAGQSVLLWKLDVEGFERSAIAGADKILTEKRVDSIAMEFVPRHLGGEVKSAELVDKIMSYGYKACYFPGSQDYDNRLPEGQTWGKKYLQTTCLPLKDGEDANEKTNLLKSKQTDIWFALPHVMSNILE